MTGIGLYAVYRAEPIIKEQIEFRFQNLLAELEAQVAREWGIQQRLLDERIRIDTDLPRYLRSLPQYHSHVLRVGILSTDGEVIQPKLKSPIIFLEVAEPGSTLKHAWELEYQLSDPASAAERYRRVLRQGPAEEKIEALLGLSRVLQQRSDWEGSVRALLELHERYGLTADETGIPRGIPALLRVVELARSYEDPILEIHTLKKAWGFLNYCKQWLKTEQVEIFEERFDFFGREELKVPQNSSKGLTEPELTLATSLKEADQFDQLRDHAKTFRREERMGYLTLGQGRGMRIISYHHLPLQNFIIYLELNKDSLISHISSLTSALEIKKDRLEVIDQPQIELGSTQFFRSLPAPLEHLHLSYRPPENQIPTHISRLETIQSAGFAWAILVLVLTLSLGVIITIRAVYQEMQLARLKSDFVSFVTHELKTPLTAIRMFTETLLMGRGGDPQSTRQCVELIDKEATRLSRLIQSILEYSKIETGQQVFRFSSGDMPEVVSEAVEIFKQHNPDTQLEIEINQAQHISKIRMDRSALVELFLNLLSNAYKYSRGANKKIVINLRESIDHISVDVVDNGIGISKRDQKKIFDKFFRANDYLTRDIEGTGLGLSFAKYIARMHNGDIKVSSQVHQGSTFTLEIQKNQIQAE